MKWNDIYEYEIMKWTSKYEVKKKNSKYSNAGSGVITQIRLFIPWKQL